ncbi:Chitinase 2 [Mycoemilia scoparia]|uniref:chitinase n=1 Tax=Mycoemilia scoparia TaxID=417184 RepID=A0A9W8DTJ3_9FUNG|nr:Chitinase 2 [Mycoemilia scoparia]
MVTLNSILLLTTALASSFLHFALANINGTAENRASGFNVKANSNLILYWGQNSRGQQDSQKPLSEYCKDGTVDAFTLAFMNGFPNIIMNLANGCETMYSGTNILNCPHVGEDIKTCQAAGKAILLSLGGASGAYGFSSDSQGAEFADTLWNMFFKGNTTYRPFGDAVLDGIDIDIEGGSSVGYAGMINRLHELFTADPSKKYYLTAAPQCPYPDSYMGTALNSAWFDMVFVQFYNNYCGLNNYGTFFNFDEWDTWAKTKSLNKDVKVYIGAPASQSSAGSGYVSADQLVNIATSVRNKYSSFGGVMAWDTSTAFSNGNWATQVSSSLKSGNGSSNGSTASGNMRFAQFAPNRIDPPPTVYSQWRIHSGDVDATISVLELNAANGNFNVLCKVKTNNQPILPHWKLWFTLPDGQQLTSAPMGINAPLSQSGPKSGNITISADPTDSSSHMAVYFSLAGTYQGKTFQFPDPATIGFSPK